MIGRLGSVGSYIQMLSHFGLEHTIARLKSAYVLANRFGCLGAALFW